jgi:hypothetical protein
MVARRYGDAFWRFTVLLLVLAPIPAALTKDRYYGLRLVPLPLLLVVVAIPAVAALVAAARRRSLAQLTAAGLVGLTAVQLVHFVDNFRYRGWARTVVFHSGVPGLLRMGFADGRTIYIDYDEPHALVYARWYGVEHGIPQSRVVRLPDGGMPPVGSVVFGRFQGCDFICGRFATADDYWLARVIGPKPRSDS